MSTTLNFVNIPDQDGDIKTIAEFINVTAIGIEAVTYMYDDHRLDKNTFTKMLDLQENLVYRIFAAFHQYELLVASLQSKSTIDLNTDPYDGDLQSHPTIYRYSIELGSIVDSIFFHLCSVFDYLAHFTSYMFEKNKDKTLDWGSLAKKARAAYKETLKSAVGIDEIDKKIRIKLEWHRSQLIHRKRDMRGVAITINSDSNQIALIFAATTETMKRFKNIIPDYNSETKYTLDCLPSAVFHETLQSINNLINFLRLDLLAHSTFIENLKMPKHKQPPYLLHPITKKLHPKSEVIWSDYKRRFAQVYLEQQQRHNAAMNKL